MSTSDLLPRWQSHKTVRAARIVGLRGNMIELAVTDPATGENLLVEKAAKMFDRYHPVIGDYYVVYDDGYASISPKAAFVAGYHAI